MTLSSSTTFYYKWFCLKLLTQTVEAIQRFGCKRAWSTMRKYDAKWALSVTINSFCFSKAWMFKRIQVLLLCELSFRFLFHVKLLANVQKTPLMTWTAVSSLKKYQKNLLNKTFSLMTANNVLNLLKGILCAVKKKIVVKYKCVVWWIHNQTSDPMDENC